MGHENDFVSDEVVDLEIKGYEKGAFKYKPTTAGEENDWLSDYMEIGPDGKPRQNFAKLNKLKMNNLTAVPYDKDMIKKIIGIEKDWCDLNIDQRWKVLGKLKGTVFDKILNAITKVDQGADEEKKD